LIPGLKLCRTCQKELKNSAPPESSTSEEELVEPVSVNTEQSPFKTQLKSILIVLISTK
jgi:hypothetical protein